MIDAKIIEHEKVETSQPESITYQAVPRVMYGAQMQFVRNFGNNLFHRYKSYKKKHAVKIKEMHYST